jgi:hypothetical protein
MSGTTSVKEVLFRVRRREEGGAAQRRPTSNGDGGNAGWHRPGKGKRGPVSEEVLAKRELKVEDLCRGRARKTTWEVDKVGCHWSPRLVGGEAVTGGASRDSSVYFQCTYTGALRANLFYFVGESPPYQSTGQPYTVSRVVSGGDWRNPGTIVYPDGLGAITLKTSRSFRQRKGDSRYDGATGTALICTP